MQYIHAYKLAATYKMTLMYFLVNIHINNQSTLYKVNGVVINGSIHPVPDFGTMFTIYYTVHLI
jgi:hypothetical protein